MSDNSERDPGQVVHRDWVQQQGFTQVENVVLRDANLSMGARLLYALLKMHAWQKDSAFPGQERLGELMGVKVRMVQIYLKELTDSGLIARKQRGGTKSNVYYIQPLSAIYCAGDTQSITGHKAQDITGHDTQSITPEEDTVKKTQKKNTKRETSAPAPVDIPTPGTGTTATRDMQSTGRKLTPGVNAPKPTLPTPLPRDWPFNPDLRAWAIDRGLTPDQADDEHDQFCAHYWSLAHSKDRAWRADWLAAEHGWFLKREQFTRTPIQKGTHRDNIIPPDKLTAKLQGIAGRIATLNGHDGTADDDVPRMRALPIAR